MLMLNPTDRTIQRYTLTINNVRKTYHKIIFALMVCKNIDKQKRPIKSNRVSESSKYGKKCNLFTLQGARENSFKGVRAS